MFKGILSSFALTLVILAIIGGIILGIFTWGYYKFAKPVYDEYESYGYGQFETVWHDPETGKIIPKSELWKYPEITGRK